VEHSLVAHTLLQYCNIFIQWHCV